MKQSLIPILLGMSPLAYGQTPAQEQFFESKVRPVLANRCYSCHSSAQSGGLRLDSREAVLKGGKSGPALVPGKPEESLLIKATSYGHEKLRMPPAERLEDAEIDGLNAMGERRRDLARLVGPGGGVGLRLSDLAAAKSILVTDPKNPLTPRVMANRIWQHHVGRGLVATPSDFGKRGIAPTHPELLDFLASKFVESGWSVKAMHRLLMQSATYQLASEGAASNLEVDANNDYLWKFSRQRLDAESLRDSLLMISGQLEPGPNGPHPFPHMGTWAYMQHGPFADVYESNRRSVYLMTQRLQRHPYLGMFDGADPVLSTASRSLTITPIQALFSMNSAFIHQTSAFWANKLMQRPDEASRVREAFRTVFGRLPEATESAKSAAYLADVRQTLGHSGAGEKEVPRQALASYLRVLLASNEFLFLE